MKENFVRISYFQISKQLIKVEAIVLCLNLFFSCLFFHWCGESSLVCILHACNWYTPYDGDGLWFTLPKKKDQNNLHINQR